MSVVNGSSNDSLLPITPVALHARLVDIYDLSGLHSIGRD